MRPIESFDEGILVRFARLNVSELTRSLCTPGHEALVDEFRSLIDPNGLTYFIVKLTAPRDARAILSENSDLFTSFARFKMTA